MKAASIAELKKELVRLEHGELLDACLRLARFKKDNKELLTYLLFQCQDEAAFANALCAEINEQFSLTPNAHKKTIATNTLLSELLYSDSYVYAIFYRYFLVKKTFVDLLRTGKILGIF